MIWKIYYTLPNNKSFCFVSRSCTSSIGLMCLKQFYPERLTGNINDGQGHRLLEYKLDDTLPPGCAIMIRNPIERFKSLLGRMNKTPEQVFSWLYWFYGIGDKPKITNRHDIEYTYGTTAYHFIPVSKFIQPDSNLFTFPNILGMTNYLGIYTDIEKINVSLTLKTEMNEKEIECFNKIYSDDIKLWESLQ